MPTIRTRTPGTRADVAGTTTETDATTTEIAGLRNRLARGGIVDHPAVQAELRKLEEVLISRLDQAGRKPGRHRSSVIVTAR